MEISTNVLGGPLKECCKDPMTGFFRDGYCRTCEEDLGRHVVCVEVSEEFLQFSKDSGNDLSTPRPEYDFPGLKPGDRWCVCAARWLQAYEAGKAAPVILTSTDISVLEIIPMDALQAYSTS